MRMFNYFNFFPVGQGLFYFGSISFGEYTFVYDCGTETSGVNLSNYIEEVAKKCNGRKLDFLAISHFHWDHISGIQELENRVGFKKVYLPYISNRSNIREFIIGIELFEDIQDLDSERIDTLGYLNNLYNKENRNFEPGSGYISCGFDWTFKYFNKSIDKGAEMKLSSMLDNLLKKYEADNVIELFKIGRIKELKKIYQDVFADNRLNNTSLVLLHYPSFGSYFPVSNYYQKYKCCDNNDKFYRCFYPYTLLTGDIMFDDELTEEIISSYPTGVSGFVQVPHHGSKFNWPPLISKFPLFDCYIVNYGTTNKYGHPDYLLKIHIPVDKYFDNNEYKGFLYEIY